MCATYLYKEIVRKERIATIILMMIVTVNFVMAMMMTTTTTSKAKEKKPSARNFSITMGFDSGSL